MVVDRHCSRDLLQYQRSVEEDFHPFVVVDEQVPGLQVLAVVVDLVQLVMPG